MLKKGRPKKYRRIHKDPKICRFSPRGKAGRPDEIDLTMDEYESVRLVDYLGKRQKEAARLMHISQQTFSRILNRARRAVADMVVNGKIMRIQGGVYVLSTSKQNDEIK